MKRSMRRTIRRTFIAIDRWYRQRRKLHRSGPVLLVGRQTYNGPARTFGDGTQLAPAQWVGELHFNNSRIAVLGKQRAHEQRRMVGVRFARLFRQSLRALAEKVQHDPQFDQLTVFHGVTGIGSHGQKIGFVSEPIPPGLKRWLLTLHLLLMSWAFSSRTRRGLPQPRRFWITRTHLLRYANEMASNGADENRYPSL